MGLRERSAEHGEVLAEHENDPAVDPAPAGHHAVARHPLFFHAEIAAAMLDEHVVFFEAVQIEQHVEPLARRQFALGMLGLDPPLAAAESRRVAPFAKFCKNFLHD